jgi:uncharacterized protein involved in response to NO
MMFGFAPAVIAGFLLAAVRNWTSLSTPTGVALAGLVAVWLVGRIAMFTGPPDLAMVVDVAFLPVLAAALGSRIWRSRNYRNLFVPVILLLLALANLAFHLAYRGSLAATIAPIAVRVAADALVCLMAVIAGRVIPAFAANAIDGFEPRRWRSIGSIAIGLLVLITLLDIASVWWRPGVTMTRTLFVLAAVIHVVRLAAWKPLAMRHNLLLVILPISYAWIPVYLLLRGWLAGSAMDLPPLALHALVIGAMSGLMLSMMTRSALGHTGRPLIAQRREAVIYLAVHAAAVTRVVFPLAWPAAHTLWVGIASVLWAVAFATFAIGYLPVLAAPRADGRPG